MLFSSVFSMSRIALINMFGLSWIQLVFLQQNWNSCCFSSFFRIVWLNGISTSQHNYGNVIKSACYPLAQELWLCGKLFGKEVIDEADEKAHFQVYSLGIICQLSWPFSRSHAFSKDTRLCSSLIFIFPNKKGLYQTEWSLEGTEVVCDSDLTLLQATCVVQKGPPMHLKRNLPFLKHHNGVG